MAETPATDSLYRFCLERRLLTPEQAAEARAALKATGRNNQAADFLDVCRKRGFLSVAQCAEIQSAFRVRVSERVVRLKSLGGFRLLEKVGEGAMGVVFKARQESLDRIVALKILSPRLAQNPVFVARFMREARAAAALNHPNIVQGIDVGGDQGFHYFAMEFVEGETASQRMKRLGGKLPLEETLEVGRQTAAALLHAHSKGLLHRDVKPDNLMLIPTAGLADKEPFTVKLMDLGLARETGESADEDPGLTRSGSTVGTPYYISPEQARGRRDIGPPADLYSLGCTLYQFATGRPPFTEGSSAVIMAAHLSAEPEDPRKFAPDLPAEFSRMVLKLLCKKPEDRFPDAAALAAEISRLQTKKFVRGGSRTGQFSGNETRGTRGPTGKMRAVSASGSRPTTGRAETVVRRDGSSFKTPLIAAAAAGSAVALLLVAYLMFGAQNDQRGKNPPHPVVVETKNAKESPSPETKAAKTVETKAVEVKTVPRLKNKTSREEHYDEKSLRVTAAFAAAERLTAERPDDWPAQYAAWSAIRDDPAAMGTDHGRLAKNNAQRAGAELLRHKTETVEQAVAKNDFETAFQCLDKPEPWEDAVLQPETDALRKRVERRATEAAEKLLTELARLEEEGNYLKAEEVCRRIAQMKNADATEKAAQKLPLLKEAAERLRAEEKKKSEAAFWSVCRELSAQLHAHREAEIEALLPTLRKNAELAGVKNWADFPAMMPKALADFRQLLSQTLSTAKEGRFLPGQKGKQYYALNEEKIQFRLTDSGGRVGSSTPVRNLSWTDLFVLAGLGPEERAAVIAALPVETLAPLGGLAVLLGEDDWVDEAFFARAIKANVPRAAETAAFWTKARTVAGFSKPETAATPSMPKTADDDLPMAKLIRGKIVAQGADWIEIEYDFSAPDQLDDFQQVRGRWEIQEGRLRNTGEERDPQIWLKIPFVGDSLIVSFSGAAATDFNCLLGPEPVAETTAGYSFRFGRGTVRGLRETQLLNSAAEIVARSPELPHPESENKVMIERRSRVLTAQLNNRNAFTFNLPTAPPAFRHVCFQTWTKAWYGNLRVRGKVDPDWLANARDAYRKKNP